MAKRKAKAAKPDKKEGYEYVIAVVDIDGELTMEYKMYGNVVARMGHDESVTGWSDSEIEACVRNLLDVEPSTKIEVTHE